MMLGEALATVDRFLAPVGVEEFLERTVRGGYRRIEAPTAPDRIGLLGADPFATLTATWRTAQQLTFHSANPGGPPPSLQGVADAEDFRRRIEEFHARRYSVRFPELRAWSASLDRLARALEVVLHVPVTASAFWSRAGMRAPVHHDDHDLLIVQLRGTKRWYVSRQASTLPNTWTSVTGDPPELGPHDRFEVKPGEIVYLPRGTLHSVDSSAESLHVSIGFTPLTLREALLAAVDHLSDLDPALRQTVGGRLAFQLRAVGVEPLHAAIREGVARLQAAAGTKDFLAGALEQRSARTIPTLRPLPAATMPAALALDTVLVQQDDAFCHLTGHGAGIDVSYPGGHVYVHLGALECVEYIVNTPRFAVRDIPGAVEDDVRLALAAKFVEIGFLAIAP